VPWHPDPEVYARRALAPAKVAKVISETDQGVITAIVDEDQLSLAIGRNGQNVRLASQLIGWQIDLYGSREWLERGADAALFGGGERDYEVVDFPLKELDELAVATLAALEQAGYTTFFDIIDLERDDLLAIEGVGEAEADQLLHIIDDLTVVDDSGSAAEAAASEAELAETRELAAEILGVSVEELGDAKDGGMAGTPAVDEDAEAEATGSEDGGGDTSEAAEVVAIRSDEGDGEDEPEGKDRDNVA
jgi:hypothetical protein